MCHVMCCVAEPPSFINTLPSVTKIAESQTATLVCQVFGAPKPVITWKKDENSVIIGGRFRKENSGNLLISVSIFEFLPSVCTVYCFQCIYFLELKESLLQLGPLPLDS